MARRNSPSVAVAAAFTLIELLIIIAVLAALSALLFPVFESAKVNGFKASSTSDLKQTFTACSLYSNEYDDRVPYAVDDCDWRGLCGSLADNQYWQTIQQDHIPPFSQALQPYGFQRILFRILAGQGPETYKEDGTSYRYGLVISSAPVGQIADHGCPYFAERGANFWNGGTYDSNVEHGERWLTLYFDGSVKYSLYDDVFTREGDCRSLYDQHQ